MPKFASGKNAYGISDRSGQRYKLRDMKFEWNNLLVGRDEWEKKQPQLDPRKHVSDPQALRNPRPTTPMVLSIYVGVPDVAFNGTWKPMNCFGQVGQVTVTTT